jgi:ubiquinone/menaquinone biosynthesis C-methylase UbiE
VATNISLEQMRVGQKEYPDINFGAMDAVALGFPAATFDNVICVEAAFHFDPRTAFIEEAFRILKPNGRLILSDILFLTLPSGRGRRLPPENAVKNPEQYEELYRRAGFRDVEVVDATTACWGGFSQNLRRWGWEKLRAGEVELPTWSRHMLRLLLGNLVIHHYLLVVAQKG